MNPPKKTKLNPSSNAPSPGRASALSTASPTAGSTMMDVVALEQQWTPNREDRIAGNQKKSRSAKCGPLRGGDWVLNESGGGATLSFCFKHGDRTFGLTVGHLADLGSSIFCFAENNKVEHPLPCGEDSANAGNSYPIYEIGTVVSKSTTTDFLVFEIFVGPFDVEIAPFKLLAPAAGLGDRPVILPNPTDPTPRPQPGDLLVGFGSQQRGAIGKVALPSIARNGTFSRIGNISILHPSDNSTSLTDPGDCGTIFVGLDGTPFYFHHCAALHGDRFSYGFPVSQVMSAHAELGGAGEAQEEAQLALVIGQSSIKSKRWLGCNNSRRTSFQRHFWKKPTCWATSPTFRTCPRRARARTESVVRIDSRVIHDLHCCLAPLLEPHPLCCFTELCTGTHELSSLTTLPVRRN